VNQRVQWLIFKEINYFDASWFSCVFNCCGDLSWHFLLGTVAFKKNKFLTASSHKDKDLGMA